MEIGFIGLGKMGQPMARRLIEAGHKLVIYDTRNDAAPRENIHQYRSDLHSRLRIIGLSN